VPCANNWPSYWLQRQMPELVNMALFKNVQTLLIALPLNSCYIFRSEALCTLRTACIMKLDTVGPDVLLQYGSQNCQNLPDEKQMKITYLA
jgi:hypothetical protein